MFLSGSHVFVEYIIVVNVIIAFGISCSPLISYRNGCIGDFSVYIVFDAL